jgi:carboxypeptidase T
MRIAVSLILASTLSCAVSVAGPRLVQVPVSNRAQVRALASLGVEIVDAHGKQLTLAVPKSGPLAVQANRLISRAVGVKVLSEDVDEYFAPYIHTLGKGAYHTVEQVGADIKQLAEKYPTLAQVVSIGKSYEQRDVQALRICGGVVGKWGRPVFLFMGCHHAREWISVEVPLAIAHALLENYETDAGIKALVDSREIYVLPMVNPDGLLYSQTEYKYWRKTRRKNDDGSFGVDPNRNYSYKWGTAGDSSYPGSDVYHGTEAFSEPETCNIRDFAIAHNLTSSVSFHSYGRTILYPWSYGDDTSPDKELFAKVAQGMSEQNQYLPQQSVELYASSGDTDDYLYGATGALSFTIELGNTFIPSESEIPGICAANVKAVRYLLEHGADPFPFLKHTPPARAKAETTIQATFDVAHHPFFKPTGVTLCVKEPEGDKEIPMTGDPATGVYTAQLPRAGAVYYFGLTGEGGKTVRTPRLGEFHSGGN